MTKDKEPLPQEEPDVEPSHNGTHESRDHDMDTGAQAVGRSKFDLGSSNGRLPSEDIPWSYGENRVTAMPRDPDWLYVYWEMTDEALEAARKRLVRGGRDAWCCLRVYDTTGRVFDGSNALSHFDVAVDRTTRDWFVHVGRPTSSCHVEVGVKSRQGEFQAVTRSGRCDFPRKRPIQDLAVEWLTVQEIEPTRGAPPATVPYESRYEGPVPEVAGPPPVAPPAAQRHDRTVRVTVQPRIERQETWRTTWQEQRSFTWSTRVSRAYVASYHHVTVPWITGPWRTEWQGDNRAFAWLRPLHQLTYAQTATTDAWEMAPYPGDSAAPGRVLVRYVGQSEIVGQQSGQSSIVFGPWEVTIRGRSHGTAEHRVLGSWLMHWVQPGVSARARWDLVAERVWFDGFTRKGVVPGASENLLWQQQGASEHWVLGGSEQLWLGMSETWAMGASELWAGASELVVGGASEMFAAWSQVWLGASEMSLEAASELLFRGASERLTFGASESLLGGASEVWGMGASESYAEASSALLVAEHAIGASEQMAEVAWVTLGELVGASELLLGASEAWGASEHLVPAPSGASEMLGASENVPGVTGPRAGVLEELPVDQAFLPDEYDWTHVGASDLVAGATYPATLDDDEPARGSPPDEPGSDDDSSNQGGA